MPATKEHLHQLVDALPDSEIQTATRYLEYLQFAASDPVRRALMAAPLDDEPETPEEAAAVAEAYAAIARGEVLSDEELQRELDQ
jgi:hypothetical protein